MDGKDDFKTLNIGCGIDSWGDVRLDVVKKSWQGVTFKANIIADAENLPFRDKIFIVSKMLHVLEHLNNPCKALEECMRVTKEELVIAFPKGSGIPDTVMRFFLSLPFSIRGFLYVAEFIKRREHKWIISPEIIIELLEKHGWKCTITKDTITLLSIFESKRTPKRLKHLNKYVPRKFHGYTVYARKVGMQMKRIG